MIARKTCIGMLFLCMVAPALGQTAGMLGFQGLIKDDQGVPLEGSVNLDFRVFDALIAGKQVDITGDGIVDAADTMQVVGVSVAAGLFSTKFGPISPSTFNGDDRFLEVSVDGEPMSRIEMVTAVAVSERVNKPGTGTAAVSLDASSNDDLVLETPMTELRLDAASSQVILSVPTASRGGVTPVLRFDLSTGTISAADSLSFQTGGLGRGGGIRMTIDAAGDTSFTGSINVSGSEGITADKVRVTSGARGAGVAELALNLNGNLELKVDGEIVDRWAGPGDAGGGLGPSPNRISGSAANLVTVGRFGVVIAGGGLGGGQENTVDGMFGTIGGGYANTVSGGPDAYASTISGGNFNTASLTAATIGGGINNTANGAASTIGGGESNTASAGHATVAGGTSNKAISEGSFVGSGFNNTASGIFATVPGGNNNVASGGSSFAAGAVCVASGESSFAAGFNCVAGGDYSFAIGRAAYASNAGMYVWADNDPLAFPALTESNFTPVANQFLARTRGGAVFVTAIDGSGNSTAGVQLASGGGSWSSLSDRNAKENFAPVNGREALEKVAAMPISTWNYKSQDPSIRHIGPMAQDVFGAFGVGEKETMITTLDADGIAFAAIQGLHELVQEKDCEIAELEMRLARLERIVAQTMTRKGGAQ